MRPAPALGEQSHGTDPVLSPGLAAHVPPEKLAGNAANYPEMQAEFSADDLERIDRIKGVLLQLPLVYSTNRSEEELSAIGILPFSKKPEHFHGNSNSLDTSLGLTDYAFMNWGVVEKSTGHGRNHQLIRTELLFDPRTIVTPGDIMYYLHGPGRENPYEQQPADIQERIRSEYFDKVVSGADWLDIASRRILRHLSREDMAPYPVVSDTAVGEVKFFGTIESGMFGDYIAPDDERQYWRWQLDHGFLPGPVRRALPYPMNNYDVSPEQLGTSLDASRSFWEHTLDIAR